MKPLAEETAAWWVWVGAQALVLAAYAAGLRPTDGYPTPVEVTAPLGLAVVQLVIGIGIAPLLATTGSKFVDAAVVAILFHVVAALMAGVTVLSTVPIALMVLLWVAAARVWGHWPIARLAFAFVTLIGPVLSYVRLEYATPQPAFNRSVLALSPTLGVCTTGLHETPWRTALVAIGLIVVGWILRQAKKGRQTPTCDARTRGGISV